MALLKIQTSSMNLRIIFSALAILILTGTAGSVRAQQINSAQDNSPRQKVRVHDPELARELSQQGAELIADYGSFQLFRVDDALARAAFSHPGAEMVDHQNIIALNARHLDTTTPEIKALR